MAEQSRSSAPERALWGVNILTIGVVIFFGFRQGGFARAAIHRWRVDRQVQARVRESWTDLISVRSTIGRLGADHVLVVFSDYLCPYCQRMNAGMMQIVRDDPSIVFVVRHVPHPSNPVADSAAVAAICAEVQGRFPAMHQRLFETTEWKTAARWEDEAVAAGIPDVPVFTECMRSERARTRVAADVALAAALGIEGTPTFLSRGSRVVGYMPEGDLRDFTRSAR